MENYEFCVQVWFEDDEWNWSIVQEFRSSNNDEDVEILAYGTAQTREAATHAVGVELSTLEFE
jgi:hypothetical protein